jgi:hypothetical protein
VFTGEPSRGEKPPAVYQLLHVSPVTDSIAARSMPNIEAILTMMRRL